MMNAYDKDYLYHSQKNFGHMVDFAINTCDYDIDEFLDPIEEVRIEYAA